MDDAVRHDAARAIADHLMGFDDDPPGVVDLEAQRLDARIDDAPLARPASSPGPTRRRGY
jgi:hypothetical protein